MHTSTHTCLSQYVYIYPPPCPVGTGWSVLMPELSHSSLFSLNYYSFPFCKWSLISGHQLVVINQWSSVSVVGGLDVLLGTPTPIHIFNILCTSLSINFFVGHFLEWFLLSPEFDFFNDLGKTWSPKRTKKWASWNQFKWLTKFLTSKLPISIFPSNYHMKRNIFASCKTGFRSHKRLRID